MSKEELENLDAYMNAVEARIVGKAAKWAWAHIGGVITVVITAAALWFGLVGRVDAIETWKAKSESYMDNSGARDREVLIAITELKSEVQHLRQDINGIKDGYRPR